MFGAICLAYLLAITMSWHKRLNLGIGLTDEGLVAAQASGSFFLQDNSWGVARIYSIMYEFSESSLSRLRFTWLAIFVLILTFLAWALIRSSQKSLSNRIVILTCA